MSLYSNRVDLIDGVEKNKNTVDSLIGKTKLPCQALTPSQYCSRDVALPQSVLGTAGARRDHMMIRPACDELEWSNPRHTGRECERNLGLGPDSANQMAVRIYGLPAEHNCSKGPRIRHTSVGSFQFEAPSADLMAFHKYEMLLLECVWLI